MTWPFENDTSAIVKKLADRSMKADKRRNAFIIITIAFAVSLMMVLALYNLGTDRENRLYLQGRYQGSFINSTSTVFEKLEHNNQIEAVGKEAAMGTSRINDYNSHFFTQIGIPENQYEAFSQGLIEGTADRQKLINGKGVIVDNSAKLLSDYYNYTPQIGDIVKVETADGQWEEFTVMGIGKAPNLGGDSASFYFPQELLPMMKENVSNFNITCIVDVERDQLTEVENKIFQLAENRGGIEVFSISDIITYLQEEMDNIKMPLYGLVFFIAVFGLISLINTLMTNIISRQQEFGILQSVGLSSKQFSKMLQTECFYYVSGTAILTLTIGTLTGFVLCKVFNQVGTFGTLTYHFPVLEISICFVALFFILAAYSVFSVRYSKRHPVIERIKTME